MNDSIRLGFAFSAGMAAAFNPCGVALLPSYVSYILGWEEEDSPAKSYSSGIVRGLLAGLLMTAGFFTVFGFFGLIFSYVGQLISAAFPWIILLIGIGLTALGALRWMGWEGPHVDTGKFINQVRALSGHRGFKPFYLYGVTYALASIGCTLPIFFILISQTFNSHSLLGAVLVFISYAGGMGLVVIGITVATFFSREFISDKVNWLMPYVHRVASAIIVVVGFYLIYYWYVHWGTGTV